MIREKNGEQKSVKREKKKDGEEGKKRRARPKMTKERIKEGNAAKKG